MEDGLDDWQGGCSVCGECPSRHGTGRVPRIHNALQANVLSLCGFLRLLLYIWEEVFLVSFFDTLICATLQGISRCDLAEPGQVRGYSNIGNNLYHQRCIFRLTCSHHELTKDHVLTSAYVKIFRTLTRNAVNKSV